MKRTVLATFAIMSLGAGFGRAQTSSPAVLAGCGARTDTAAKIERRSGGSSTAKASTPIRGNQTDALAPRQESAGSNSPKASTPIGAATTPRDGRRTGGATTPKGSVPITGTPCAQ